MKIFDRDGKVKFAMQLGEVKTCKGTKCTSIEGRTPHSHECKEEHDRICSEAEQHDHIAHGGWKCRSCNYDGQENVSGNFFCVRCARHK